ncbi:MAG: PD40 domain-containing protein [Anaerolineales bacterium]|nr:PD40 domain-containing protein [Anaerolineales bacterium]
MTFEAADQPGRTKADIIAYPVDDQGKATQPVVPQLIASATEPQRCSSDNLFAAPNGQYLIRQYNCQDTVAAQLLNLNQPTSSPISLAAGYFLAWAPSGDWFLYRQIEDDQIVLIEAADTAHQIPLDLSFGTYDAAFTPDGQQITYAASAGLRMGSEVGTINLKDGTLVFRHEFPRQIAAFARWSPDGQQLAYILMPDSNIPFPQGELWLANIESGAPTEYLADVDAGHGFPPAWSADSQTLVYVHRENPDMILADQQADALHSNIHQIDIASGSVTPLTAFSDSQVYAAVWSPDGQTLAFTAADAVWQVIPGQLPTQVSNADIARHPTWLSRPATKQ